MQEPEASRSDAKARKRSAEELGTVYNDLVGYAFQHADIQAALTAVQGSSLPDALDWLCMHLPPERLPHRFAGTPPSPHSTYSCSIVRHSSFESSQCGAQTMYRALVAAETAYANGRYNVVNAH